MTWPLNGSEADNCKMAYCKTCGITGAPLGLQRRGVHTVKVRVLTDQIVMSYSPAVVGCFLTKGLQKGRAGEGSQATQDPPRYPL